jgi:beta-phosphoglucomutase-like phosphatase (HAD superfamily)
VVEWLDEAHRLNMAIGIASSSHVEWVQGHLERLELIDRFACLSCFDDVLQAKPAPDLYLAACESLGVDPAQAVAVEDSRNGILAAKAAGMAAVAVPHGLTEHLDFTEADLRLSSLAEMPLRTALSRLTSA